MGQRTFYAIKEKITRTVIGGKEKCYLLIDASLEQYQSGEGVNNILSGYKSCPVAYHHSELQSALPLFIFLIDIKNKRDEELLNNSISHALKELDSDRLDSGEGRSVCAWIATHLTGEQLAEQVAHTTLQSIGCAGEILLRYFDPSVLGLLMPALDGWQKQQLFSNITTWSYIDGDGIFRIINGDGDCRKKLSYSLGLTELNISEIKRISLINNILRIYRKTDVRDKLNEYEIAELLYPALRYFYLRFFPSDNDAIEFGLDVLNARRLFYQDEIFSHLVINQPDKNPLSYSEVKSSSVSLSN